MPVAPPGLENGSRRSEDMLTPGHLARYGRASAVRGGSGEDGGQVTVLVLGTGPAGLVLGCLLQAAARLQSPSSSRARQDYFAENYVGI